MKNPFCKGGADRETWAVSLCFAATVLMSLEALRPNACQWLGFSAQQSFTVSALLATLTMFMGSFILTRRLTA